MGLEVLQAMPEPIHIAGDGLGLGSCPASERRFEILRATIWSLAALKAKTHVNRILNASLPAWQLLSERPTSSEETLRAELREALSTLADAGDLIELSGGYWAPATARVVILPDGAGHLLIGGVPSSLLQLGNDAIQYHGPHRHFAKIPAKLAAVLPVEDFNSWARLPDVPLQDWVREVFDSLERFPYTPTTADVFEFYLPANSKPGAPQFFRWSESAGDITCTLLSRRRRLFGAREYRLVDVCSGQIVSACEFHGIDVRRLMYALDLEAKNPVLARPLRLGDRTEWLFTSELPRAEQRTFAAFGTLKIPDGRHFERRWTFTRNEEIALDMLRSLGIALGQ